MITLMAILAKEAMESINNKEKRQLEKIFGEIEKEIQADEALKSILTLQKVDNLEKLFLFINNPGLKEKLREKLDRLKISLSEIKISLLESAREINEEFEKIGVEDEIIYYSLNVFKNGEKISGKIIKEILNNENKQENGHTKDKKIEFYEFDSKTNEVKKSSITELKKEAERTEEELIEKKKKEDITNPDFGMPKRGNPGVNGPGL